MCETETLGIVIGVVIGVIVNLIGMIFVKYIDRYFIDKMLKSGHFIGLPWQKELFDLVYNYDPSRRMKGIIWLDKDTDGWTMGDLSMFYSPNMVRRFYANRERIKKEPNCAIILMREFDRNACKNMKKMINKIYGEIDTTLKYDILPEISSLESKIPSIDNIDMATAKAKRRKLAYVSMMQKALIEIRDNVANLLQSVTNYEQSYCRLHDKHSFLMNAWEAPQSIYYWFVHRLYYARYRAAELLKSPDMVYDEYDYNFLVFGGGAANDNYRKSIDYKIGHRLYHVRGEIENLNEVKKVEGGIDFLNHWISYYESLGDADSIIEKLVRARDDLNSIRNELFAIISGIYRFPKTQSE